MEITQNHNSRIKQPSQNQETNNTIMLLLISSVVKLNNTWL